MYGAEVPGLADAHVNGHETGTLSVVARYKRLANRRPQIEVAEWRADDIRTRVIAIGARRSKRRTLREHSIGIGVLTGRDIEWRATARHDERIQTHLPPWQVQGTRESETMPHIERRAAKFAGQVVRIRRKQ